MINQFRYFSHANADDPAVKKNDNKEYPMQVANNNSHPAGRFAKLTKAALMGSVFCLSSGAYAQEITYTDWWGGIGLTTPVIEFMESDYEAKNPGKDINRSVVAYPQMLNQMTLASIAQNSPDYYMALAAWIPTLQAVGGLQPLNEGLFTDEYLAKIPAVARDAVSIDGALYALPLVPGPITLQYNRNLLKEAGFDGPAKTWEELKEQVLGICKLKTANGEKVYGIALRTKRVANSAQWFIPIVYGHGGDVVDADGNPDLNTPAMAAALQWVKDVAEAGCTPKGASIEETRSLMSEGRAGFFLEGPWGRGLVEKASGGNMMAGPDADFWVTTMPADQNGNVRSIANDHVLVISSSAKNQEGAQDILRYMTSDSDFTTYAYETTSFMTSANKDILSAEPMASDEYIQVHVAALASANTNPIKHPKFSGMMDELIVTIQKVISGGDIQQELDGLDGRIERVLQD